MAVSKLGQTVKEVARSTIDIASTVGAGLTAPFWLLPRWAAKSLADQDQQNVELYYLACFTIFYYNIPFGMLISVLNTIIDHNNQDCKNITHLTLTESVTRDRLRLKPDKINCEATLNFIGMSSKQSNGVWQKKSLYTYSSRFIIMVMKCGQHIVS